MSTGSRETHSSGVDTSRPSRRTAHPGQSMSTPNTSQVPGFDTYDQEAAAIEREKPWVQRKRTYIAQALILFNVHGASLSVGPYLEYYYNTRQVGKSSVLEPASAVAVQLLFIFAMTYPAGWLYINGWQRGTLWLAAIAASVCQVLLAYCKQWWQVLVVRGIGQGTSLGTLGTVGTLCLASHYKNNTPLASMIGASAGLLGALVYTLVAYMFLQDFGYTKACYVNCAITTSTLFLAALLGEQNKAYAKLNMTKGKRPHDVSPSSPSFLFEIGYLATVFGLFTWPTYMVLLLSSTSSDTFPTKITERLLIIYAVSIPSAALSSSPWFRNRLGPVNTFICASLIAGATYINSFWTTNVYIPLVSSIIFGACLGAIMALYIKVITVFDGVYGNATLRVATSLWRTGVFAALGIVIMACLVQVWDKGVQWGCAVMGAIMLLGGAVMGVARGQVVGWRFYVVV